MKAILFDLDGTLLPMDQDLFVKTYFKLLAVKLTPYGYDPKQLIDAIWGGTAAMVKNNGSCSNEDAFWTFFTGIFGKQALEHLPVFEDFYANEFNLSKNACGYREEADRIIKQVKAKGLKAVLATNPLLKEYVAYAVEKSNLFLYFNLNLICLHRFTIFLIGIILLLLGVYSITFILGFSVSKNIPSFFSNTSVISYSFFTNSSNNVIRAVSIPPSPKECAANSNFFIFFHFLSLMLSLSGATFPKEICITHIIWALV